jgi:hypothetical protein
VAAVVAGPDVHGFHAVGQDHVGGVDRGEEAFEPPLEPQSVVEDQIRVLRPDEVRRRGFVAVDLRTDLRDRLDAHMPSGDGAGEVREHGEGGQDERAVVHRLRASRGGGAPAQHGEQDDPPREACGRGRPELRHT